MRRVKSHRCNLRYRENEQLIPRSSADKQVMQKKILIALPENNNNNELYLHDHTWSSTYSIAKAIFRNQNYIIEQYRPLQSSENPRSAQPFL